MAVAFDEVGQPKKYHQPSQLNRIPGREEPGKDEDFIEKAKRKLQGH